MTTPTRLDPRVFEAAANGASHSYATVVVYTLEAMKMLGAPFGCIEKLHLDKMARAIALDLCAHILRDEQRRARK
jgi:hypothetical protein